MFFNFLGSNRLPFCDYTLGTNNLYYVGSASANILPNLSISASVGYSFPGNWLLPGQELVISSYYNSSVKSSFVATVVSSSGPSQITVSPNVAGDYSTWIGETLIVKQYCPPLSNYFTNEKLSFLLNIGSYYSTYNKQVIGNPKFRFKITSSSGTYERLAELNKSISDINAGYFQFDYLIQGSDNGSISFYTNNNYGANRLDHPFINDNENTIMYYNFGLYDGNGGWYFADANLWNVWNQKMIFDPYSIPIADSNTFARVAINMDSGSYTGNQCRILVKRSDQAGKVPTTQDLLEGELALNIEDGKIFFKKKNGTIVSTTLT